MTDQRLDVGFVPVECPGADGTGATHTSTLLIEHLSTYHDLTVYVASQRSADRSSLPARDRVEYVLSDELPMLPHPIRKKHEVLDAITDTLATHDLVHSYSSGFIPVLADVDTPTLSTLNSYLPVCPKADLRYHGQEKCSGPGPLKCGTCIPSTSLRRRQGLVPEAKSAYLSFGRGSLVKRSFECRDQITAFHALSPHLRDDYVDLGFPADAITVVPHFYDDRFCPPENAQSGPEYPSADRTGVIDDPTLLYTGALKQIKGIDVLVRALPILEERGYDFDLRVAGRGPYESTARSLAETLGVDDRITWLGYVDYDELPVEYLESDVFVYPGVIDEPFGRVMLEALASHTPIASADIGSMDYIVGSAGQVFDPGDQRQLADCIEHILLDYESYCQNIPDQLDRFSPDTVVEQLLTLYQDTVSRSQ